MLADAIKQARLKRNQALLDLLTTVYSNVKQKVKDGVDPKLAQIKEIERAISSRRESIQIAGPGSYSDMLLSEIDILSQFLPKKLSKDEIEAALQSYLESNPSSKLGTIMSFFKNTYPGLYDGKELSNRCRELGLS